MSSTGIDAVEVAIEVEEEQLGGDDDGHLCEEKKDEVRTEGIKQLALEMTATAVGVLVTLHGTLRLVIIIIITIIITIVIIRAVLIDLLYPLVDSCQATRQVEA
jgi:energy-converting hydrogenase Eha subunit E